MRFPVTERAPSQLRLYVAGDGPNSLQARSNLERICAAAPGFTYTLEVIDFLADPLRALADGVLVTPTLVKVGPAPRQAVVGTLADIAKVQRTLGITPAEEGP
jgi:circadian clock protein KaiB